MSSSNKKSKRRQHKSLPKSLTSSPYHSSSVMSEHNSSPSSKYQFSRRGKSPYSIPLQLPEQLVPSSNRPSKNIKSKCISEKEPKFPKYFQQGGETNTKNLRGSSASTTQSSPESLGHSNSSIQRSQNYQAPLSPYSVASSVHSFGFFGSPMNSPYESQHSSKAKYFSDGMSCSGSTNFLIRKKNTLKKSAVSRTIMLPWEVEDRLIYVFGETEKQKNQKPIELPKDNNVIANLWMKNELKCYDETNIANHSNDRNDNGNELDDAETIESDTAYPLNDERVFSTCYRIQDEEELDYLTRHLDYNIEPGEDNEYDILHEVPGSSLSNVKLPPVEKSQKKNSRKKKKIRTEIIY